VDARDEPGHDELEALFHPLRRGLPRNYFRFKTIRKVG
jgi:hypothetical protein